MIIVYTTAGCTPCRMTKNLMAKLGVEFEERRVDLNDQWRREAQNTGAMSLPVVVLSNGEHWSQFRRDRIMELANTIPAAQ